MQSLMKTTVAALHALALAALFAGVAHAADTVDINTADAKTIDRVLINIGPAKAEAIVAPHPARRRRAKTTGQAGHGRRHDALKHARER